MPPNYSMRSMPSVNAGFRLSTDGPVWGLGGEIHSATRFGVCLNDQHAVARWQAEAFFSLG
jgi:hypothetical protein